MDYLFTFLIQYYPEVALYAIILLLVIVVTIRVHNFYIRTDELHKRMPFMETTLSRIDTGLTLLNKMILEKTIISQSCYSNENSPRSISPLGEHLLKESGANTIFEAKKSDLVVELESKKINSLLELEREALNVMLAHGDDLSYKPIQDFAFQHPTYKNNPLTYSDILFLIALKLRDFYRGRHTDLTAEQ